MVTCRSVCSSLVVVLLLIACIVAFVLHSLYYVQRFLDASGTQETLKRVVESSQRIPTVIICNRLPFYTQGVNQVNGNLGSENTMRYLREWVNPSYREYPEYLPMTSTQSSEGMNAVSQYLQFSNRRSSMQQTMQNQCSAVISQCSFNGQSYGGSTCCNAVQNFIPTLNGLCWAYTDVTMVANSSGLLRQFSMTFQVPRGNWFVNSVPTHPGIDIYLRENAEDVLRLANDLAAPPKITLRDKMGVRVRMTKDRYVDTKRPECGMSATAASAFDTNSRTGNRSNILMCSLLAATQACGCHPLLSELLTYQASSMPFFSERTNNTQACTVDQYDSCARRYVETGRADNVDDPLPMDLPGIGDLQRCRRDNVFPCQRTMYDGTPEFFSISSETTSTDYYARLVLDFETLNSNEVLQDRPISLYELLSYIGWNVACWFAIGHIIWTVFGEIRDALCRPKHRVSPEVTVPPAAKVNGAPLLPPLPPPSLPPPPSMVTPPSTPPTAVALPPPVTPPRLPPLPPLPHHHTEDDDKRKDGDEADGV